MQRVWFMLSIMCIFSVQASEKRDVESKPLRIVAAWGCGVASHFASRALVPYAASFAPAFAPSVSGPINQLCRSQLKPEVATALGLTVARIAIQLVVACSLVLATKYAMRRLLPDLDEAQGYHPVRYANGAVCTGAWYSGVLWCRGVVALSVMKQLGVHRLIADTL